MWNQSQIVVDEAVSEQRHHRPGQAGYQNASHRRRPGSHGRGRRAQHQRGESGECGETQYATLRTSGPAAYTSAPDGKGRNLAALRTPFAKPRFETETDADGRTRYFQNSMVEPNMRWEIVQTLDTITPSSEHYNVKSHMAKTVRITRHEAGEPAVRTGQLVCDFD